MSDKNVSLPLNRAVTVQGRAVTVTVESAVDLAPGTVFITAHTSSGDRYASARKAKGKWQLSVWQDEEENPVDVAGLTPSVVRLLSSSGVEV